MYFTDFASLVEIDIFFDGLLRFRLSILRSLQGNRAASINSVYRLKFKKIKLRKT